VSADVLFSVHDGGFHVVNNQLGTHFDKIKPIILGDNVYIGFGSVILGGVTIGDNVVIGANSTVTKSIPSNCVAAGCPAKVICSIDEYYKKHKDELEQTSGMKRNEKRAFYTKKYPNT
jgi:acetyltransferase-like isoleucine patch superfamily enzyme